MAEQLGIERGMRKEVQLVVGGSAHDFDFVRMQLLQMLGENPCNRVAVSSTWEEFSGEPHRALVSYTCNLDPTPEAARRLKEFVERGGRWLALHATNSILDWGEQGVSGQPPAGDFLDTLGSAFQAHPPIGPYRIEAGPIADPITRGIGPFTVSDELYLSDFSTDVEVLLKTSFGGAAPGFVRDRWSEGDHPVLYRRRLGEGEVLYFTPGHARGHYDAPHRTPFYPVIERGAWEEPSYVEILRRCLLWVCHAPMEEALPS
jgi:uncharacterized protein